MSSYKNCGQVGFWACAATASMDLIKWGQNGGVENPYKSYQEAEDQCRALAETKTHKFDRFYILNVFSNGRIRTDEVQHD